MPAALHLLIPFANACLASMQRTAAPEHSTAHLPADLPRLRRLLSLMDAGPLDAGSLSDLSLPHERARARVLGLPDADGRMPWAAWEMAQSGGEPGSAPWAWITPCHWHVARDHIRMDPPAGLDLDEAQSRQILAAMAPYFEQDGILLTYESPARWRARGEIFEGLACASLDRVTGRNVDDWLPRGPEARHLRRLQQEMQMLMYTHPVNEAREHAGLQPVNSFWASGVGALPTGLQGARPTGLLQIDERLRAPALAGQWDAWGHLWRQIDAQVLPALLEAVEQGQSVALTLCGERSARTWTSDSSPSWWRRATRAWRAPKVAAVLEPL